MFASFEFVSPIFSLFRLLLRVYFILLHYIYYGKSKVYGGNAVIVLPIETLFLYIFDKKVNRCLTVCDPEIFSSS